MDIIAPRQDAESKQVVLVDVTKFLRETLALSAAETGALISLAIYILSEEDGAPLDDKRAARVAGASPKAWQRIWPGISRFFEEVDGRLHCRLDAFRVEWRSEKQSRPGIPPEIASAVRERDGEVCTYCGSGEGPFHLDHIHPWSRGGRHEISNLTVACAPCNLSKGNKTVEEWRGRQ